MNLAPHLTRLIESYKGLSPRERLMLAGGTAVAVFFLVDFLLIQPQLREQRQLQERLELLAMEEQALMGSLQAASRQNTAARSGEAAEREALIETLARADALLAPARQNADIEAALRALSQLPAGVTLKSLRAQAGQPLVVTVPPSAPPSSSAPAGAPASDASPPAVPALYSKPVSLDMEGTYPDLMRALAMLESRPGLVWGDLSITADQLPISRMSLSLRVLTPTP